MHVQGFMRHCDIGLHTLVRKDPNAKPYLLELGKASSQVTAGRVGTVPPEALWELPKIGDPNIVP